MFRLMTFEVLKLVNQFGLYLFISIMKEIPPLWRDFLIPNDVNQFGLYLFLSISHHPKMDEEILCKLYRQSCKALRKQINSS